jgi:signal transduction histidine kinase
MIPKVQRFFSSIRAKLVFWFVAIAIVPLGISITFGFIHTSTLLRNETLKALIHIAPDIEAYLQACLDKGGESQMADYCRAFPKQDLLRRKEKIYLVNEQGMTIYLSEPNTNQPRKAEEKADSVGIARCREQKKTISGVFTDSWGNKVCGVYRWLDNMPNIQEAAPGGAKAGQVLAIEIAETDLLAPLINIRKNALTLSGILFVLIVTTGMLVARSVAKPILQFVKATERIRLGNLAERVKIKSKDEIGALASEFNSMAAKLEDVYNNLEESFAQRTRELENTQQQLVRSEKLAAVGSLAASIAHEVRNPLAGISGAIQVLADGFTAEDSRRDVVKKIREQIDRLDSIINDLLEFAKPKPPELIRCDVRDLLNESLLHIQSGPKIERMTILKEYANTLPQVQIDPNQMEQVLTNLIINAADAVPAENGQLRIGVSINNSSMELTFRDNGPGIDEKILATIFDPFFTTKHRGTGLGLSITRKIVEAHGGSIAARNNSEEGACFIIWLPLESELEPEGV